MRSDGSTYAAGRTTFGADRSHRGMETDRWLAGLLGDEREVALVAVGSHGRRELTPGSDLDLVLLHRGRTDVGELADRLWYPIWDSGARLDHAVRTVGEARKVARGDLKAALGLIYARHVAGAPELTEELRQGVLGDWRADARNRLPELREMAAQRAERHGELAFLLEPDVKEARGGLRDVHAIQAVAAAWVAPAPGPKVRAAYDLILDVRHALHEVTSRPSDKLVLQDQDAVAGALGLLDADVLLRALAEAGRTIAYAADHTWRQVVRSLTPRRRRGRIRGRSPLRRPLADGVVDHDGEVVLARTAAPETDPALVLRAAAAAARAGLPFAPRTLDRLAAAQSPSVPWPRETREALVALLGTGPAAIPVWEALDQAGVVVTLLPDWERVRNRPQRNPLHRFTVDRHLVETAAYAASHTREVARPDLLLLAALLHDVGKGWPGDHSDSGAVVARNVGTRVGLPTADVAVLTAVVRHHLLLPQTATRRDLDDPVTVRTVAETVGDHETLHLLAALADADGRATGPTAWNAWKAGLVGELVRRVDAALAGRPLPEEPRLSEEQAALARRGGPAVAVDGSTVTVVAPDRPGLLWRAAGVLALHRLEVRAATSAAEGPTAVIQFTAVPEFGSPPDATLLADDLRRMLDGRLDVAARLESRRNAYRTTLPVAPPRVTLLDDASHTATVVEVRANDEPGILWRIGRALGDCRLSIRAARVETLGAEAVDAFYVLNASGRPLTRDSERDRVRAAVMDALRDRGREAS
ncbi:MAG: [protein-PII] uridylyltransferase [Streptosporangiales bacterium]|nr:[protein-PII] uridylyltransferase [Streptosporangiales bacterium]